MWRQCIALDNHKSTHFPIPCKSHTRLPPRIPIQPQSVSFLKRYDFISRQKSKHQPKTESSPILYNIKTTFSLSMTVWVSQTYRFNAFSPSSRPTLRNNASLEGNTLWWWGHIKLVMYARQECVFLIAFFVCPSTMTRQTAAHNWFIIIFRPDVGER